MFSRGFLSDGAIWFHVLPLLLSPEWKKSIINFNHFSTISYVNCNRTNFFMFPAKIVMSRIHCRLISQKPHQCHLPRQNQVISALFPNQWMCGSCTHRHTSFSNLFTLERKIRFVTNPVVHSQLRVVEEVFSIVPSHRDRVTKFPFASHTLSRQGSCLHLWLRIVKILILCLDITPRSSILPECIARAWLCQDQPLHHLCHHSE